MLWLINHHHYTKDIFYESWRSLQSVSHFLLYRLCLHTLGESMFSFGQPFYVKNNLVPSASASSHTAFHCSSHLLFWAHIFPRILGGFVTLSLFYSSHKFFTILWKAPLQQQTSHPLTNYSQSGLVTPTFNPSGSKGWGRKITSSQASPTN